MTEPAMIETMLQRLREKLERHGHSVNTEDAIKAVLVSPFLTGLGHDVSDPDMVSVGVRNDQGRADYVIHGTDGAADMYAIIVSNPEDIDGPRPRAAMKIATAGRTAMLLTNGRRYHFHLNQDGTLAEDAFLTFDAEQEIVDPSVLMPLARGSFHLEDAIAIGRTTRLNEVAWERLLEETGLDGEIRATLARLVDPNNAAPERARAGAAEALARLGRVMRDEESAVRRVGTDDEEDERRLLNNEEQAAFEAVKAIASRTVNPNRVHARPAQTYLAILLDNNNRRTICRLYFTAQSTRYVGTFVGRTETKHRIESHQDVQRFDGQIDQRVHELDPGATARPVSPPPPPATEAETTATTISPPATEPSTIPSALGTERDHAGAEPVAGGATSDTGSMGDAAGQPIGMLGKMRAVMETAQGAVDQAEQQAAERGRGADNAGDGEEDHETTPPGYVPADDAWRSEAD